MFTDYCLLSHTVGREAAEAGSRRPREATGVAEEPKAEWGRELRERGRRGRLEKEEEREEEEQEKEEGREGQREKKEVKRWRGCQAHWEAAHLQGLVLKGRPFAGPGPAAAPCSLRKGFSSQLIQQARGQCLRNTPYLAFSS